MLRRLLFAGRLVLGAVFIYAAYSKLRQPWALFALSIDSYRILPEWTVIGVARGLPWLELALGVLLILGFGLRYVALISSVILTGFLGVMFRAHLKGLGIDCGCFGVGEALSLKTLARDSLLLLTSLLVTWGAFRTARRAAVAQATAGAEAAAQRAE